MKDEKLPDVSVSSTEAEEFFATLERGLQQLRYVDLCHVYLDRPTGLAISFSLSQEAWWQPFIGFSAGYNP